MSTEESASKASRKPKAAGLLARKQPRKVSIPVTGREAGPAAGLAAIAETDIASGLYESADGSRDELRLDVDGPAPQMAVSGVIKSGLANRLHWIARLAPAGSPGNWTGEIWFKDGTTALLPHSKVEVGVTKVSGARQATVRFIAGNFAPMVRTHHQKSPYFHPVEFEFDAVEGSTAVTEIDTHAHPNRPAGLPRETLDISTVYRRAGFDVSTSGGGNRVPLSIAGANQTWSDTEMHDAMQAFWSHFANKEQWSLWALFAALHDEGPSLGGIMFDDIGPNHRQGTAIFNSSFISVPPDSDVAPDAWVRRMKFWTACHEMGHAFNLAHSWQKELGAPWIPVSNEPEVRSFMNYPFRVSGGQTRFFSDFNYRFSDQELLFMRHAPERFVEMGNADWFDDHAFEQVETSPEPEFRIELRANRPAAVFEFLEPCVLEIKLTNISGEPRLVGEQVLKSADSLLVIIKPHGKPARQWLPFAHYCFKGRSVVLEPSASRYESLFIGAGRNGWDMAEPGNYTVQVALRISGVDYISAPLQARVKPPRSYDEEDLAQDFFSDEVGRVLAFDGTRSLDRANDILRETATRFSGRAVAHHALVALGKPLLREGKVLALPGRTNHLNSAASAGGKFNLTKANPNEAQKDLTAALMKQPGKAAETLGHIDYKWYVDDYSADLAATGDGKAAAAIQDTLFTTLTARKVAPWVLAEIAKRRAGYASK